MAGTKLHLSGRGYVHRVYFLFVWSLPNHAEQLCRFVFHRSFRHIVSSTLPSLPSVAQLPQEVPHQVEADIHQKIGILTGCLHQIVNQCLCRFIILVGNLISHIPFIVSQVSNADDSPPVRKVPKHSHPADRVRKSEYLLHQKASDDDCYPPGSPVGVYESKHTAPVIPS